MEELRACNCGAVDRLRVGAIEVDHSGYYLSSVNCSACRCAGPVVEVKGEEQAIASAIAAWNARPAEDALRGALVQARSFMLRHVPADSDEVCDTTVWYCECCEAPLNEDGSHSDGQPDCEYQQTLATINAALEVKP